MIDNEYEIIWNNCKKMPRIKVKEGKYATHWLDLEEGVRFSSAQNWTNTPSLYSSFMSSKEDFLNNQQYGLSFVKELYHDAFGEDMLCSEEAIFQNIPQLEKFKDSKILVVGAGPTAIQCDWDPEEYDYVFSCNHFYHNEKMKNIDVSFAFFTGETDFSENNEKFHNYLENNSTIICIEDKFKKEDYFQSIKNKYPDRAIYAHTRFRCKIGTVPRLLCMAVLLGAKEVHIVGMDGLKKGDENGEVVKHAFQGKKVRTGKGNYGVYKRGYVFLWDYLLNDIGKNVKFQNLGEGHPSNMSTDISRQNFPLEEKYKKLQKFA